MKRPNPDIRLPVNRQTSLLFDWRADYALRSPLSLDAIRHVATFTRASVASGIDTEGYLYPVVNGQWRTGRWQSPSSVWEPYLLLEPARTNDWVRSEEIDNASWVKTNLTITADAVRAPDGTLTADRLVETAAASVVHTINQTMPTWTDNTAQATTFFGKPGERLWCWVRTTNKANRVDVSYVNLSTVAVGTVDANHTVRLVALANGWVRVTVILDSAQTGGTTPLVEIGLTTGDGVTSYTGSTANGLYVWGPQLEANQVVETSYIKTTTAAVTRSADVLALTFAALPRDLTLYADLIELGTQTLNGTVAAVGADANQTPRAMIYATSGTYKPHHHNGTSSVDGGTPSGTLAYGARAELVMTLTTAGVVTLSWLPAGAGGVTTGSASAALALNETAWGVTKVSFNRYNGATAEGCIGLRKVKLAAGGAVAFATMQTVF